MRSIITFEDLIIFEQTLSEGLPNVVSTAGSGPEAAHGDQDPDSQKPIDKLQMALDVAGLEPTWGTIADLANTGISLGRATSNALKGDFKGAIGHVGNSLISAVSVIPFGDVVKILKTPKFAKLLKPKTALNAAKRTKTALKAARGKRQGQSAASVAGGFNQNSFRESAEA